MSLNSYLIVDSARVGYPHDRYWKYSLCNSEGQSLEAWSYEKYEIGEQVAIDRFDTAKLPKIVVRKNSYTNKNEWITEGF